jgi:hypothetical protein
MSRCYPDRWRKRKGRPPPNRYQGPTVRPDGLQDFGLKYLYDWDLPQLGVRDRRQMFNRAAAGSISVAAASCAVVGASLAGGAGAIGGGQTTSSATIASSAEENVTIDRGCHG